MGKGTELIQDSFFFYKCLVSFNPCALLCYVTDSISGKISKFVNSNFLLFLYI